METLVELTTASKEAVIHFFEVNPERRMEMLNLVGNKGAFHYLVPIWHVLVGEAEKQFGFLIGEYGLSDPSPNFLRIHAAVWGTLNYMATHDQPLTWSEIQEMLKEPSFVKERDEAFEKWNNGTGPLPMLKIWGG